MTKFRILRRIFKQTNADRILFTFFLVYLGCSVVIWIWEPGIDTLGSALWYCYAVITTIGFGDVVVATPLSRVVSILLSCYAIIAIAIITGVVVNYYNQIVELRKSETITAFLDRLEHLPDMSKDELKELSESVRKMREKR